MTFNWLLGSCFHILSCIGTAHCMKQLFPFFLTGTINNLQVFLRIKFFWNWPPKDSSQLSKTGGPLGRSRKVLVNRNIRCHGY